MFISFTLRVVDSEGAEGEDVGGVEVESASQRKASRNVLSQSPIQLRLHSSAKRLAHSHRLCMSLHSSTCLWRCSCRCYSGSSKGASNMQPSSPFEVSPLDLDNHVRSFFRSSHVHAPLWRSRSLPRITLHLVASQVRYTSFNISPRYRLSILVPA